jgi:hypothetical protein
MTRKITRLLAPAGVLALAACAGAGTAVYEPPEPGIGVEGRDGATIVTADELERTDGSVLDAIRGKIPNMRVDLSPQRCPAITLRTYKRLHGENYPDVYLDGTRAQNTCILETLAARDVGLVEVYPQGFTTRPGYRTSGHGLILLFSRRY